MTTRFDLEQQILDCWNVTTDLRTLCAAVGDDQVSQDKIMNILIGMEELYELKFDQMFRTFEKHLQEVNDGTR
jgi:hypothetical protein